MQQYGRKVTMTPVERHPRAGDLQASDRLSPDIAVLGVVSLLMGMSSAMIYGLLPVFLVTVLAVSPASVGLIEGIAEATTSLVKVFSGAFSDRISRRKPLVLAGYALSAINKLLFPIAESASMVLLARVADRLGKGMRDAPRDALVADITPSPIRGAGFGLRSALYTIGAVVGPLAAMALMWSSAGDFRLVFWIALIPGAASVVVLLVAIQERPLPPSGRRPFPIRAGELSRLPAAFWWVIAIAALLTLARFSPAFLVLKAHEVHTNPAIVPMILVVMYLVYSAAAYPFGVLADRIERRGQLAASAAVLIVADWVLASSGTIEMTLLGAALWGLQMGMSQGLLAAAIADAAPEQWRGTAFGLFDLVTGLATFSASAGAGTIWMLGGASASFVAGAAFAAGAVALVLMLRLFYRRHAIGL